VSSKPAPRLVTTTFWPEKFSAGPDGAAEGAADGAAEGAVEGAALGATDGAADGATEGAADGALLAADGAVVAPLEPQAARNAALRGAPTPTLSSCRRVSCASKTARF
jgi:hypothetical protein